MKAKYLKPAFLEKSDDVKLTFVVTADEAAQVFSLKRGESYEIAPYSQEVAGDMQSPTEKLEMAQRLIGEVMGCDTIEPTLPLDGNHCGNCGEFVADERENADPDGHCNWNGTPTHSGVVACDEWKTLKTVKKCCGTCAEWVEDNIVPMDGDSSGHCREIESETKSQYGNNCDGWREDK